MKRRTDVVQGRLAYSARRAKAAHQAEIGLQILTVAQLVSRLAGGFSRKASSEEIEVAIRLALEEGGFEDIQEARDLPGMTLAVARTLTNAWNADFPLERESDRPRIRDLALIEQRVRSHLPEGALLPQSLKSKAIEGVRFAPATLGDVTLNGIHFIEPIWRPVVEALRQVVPLRWLAPEGAETGWFAGRVVASNPSGQATPTAVTCSDPRHEVLEAFRWARELLATGRAKAHEIAIAATTTDEWDDHVLALAAETRLRVSFLHGQPCLSTFDGQRCAALADVLLRGINQARVRRLIALTKGQGTVLDTAGSDWLRIPRYASVTSSSDWQRLMERLDLDFDPDPRPEAMRILRLLERGIEAAEEVADVFLRGRARQLWHRALCAAPAAAIELSLRSMRVEDEQDAADAIAWTPAWQLAAAPRPWVRLLGLTGRSWPRPSGEDPLLPEHLLGHDILDADPPSRADRRAFGIISRFASGELVMSRSRRNSQGARVGASPLFSPGLCIETLNRQAPASHAASESDRLGAHPEEMLADAALQCWHNWHVTDLTVHDGRVAPPHPVIAASLEQTQSPTSLRRMLRDPLGFVWKCALGWNAPEHREDSLKLSDSDFGSLVHELLRRSVDALEPNPGFTRANREEITQSLDQAAIEVLETWPLERAVPPALLWQNTVRQASTMALEGLTWESFAESGTRSWTEVPFGESSEATTERELPWDPAADVVIPGTRVKIRGKIDRLDLTALGNAVRVTDYKTGERPKNAASMIIAGGDELQRVLYAVACRALLSGPPRVVPRLVYLKDEAFKAGIADLDGAVEQMGQFVNLAADHLMGRTIAPGPAAEDVYNDMRLALPASPGYFRRKQSGFDASTTQLRRMWRAK